MPELSPDGKYWWNGQQWLPVAAQEVTASGSSAMKAGFFGAMGVWIFGCIGGCIIPIIVFGLLMGGCAAFMGHPSNFTSTP